MLLLILIYFFICIFLIYKRNNFYQNDEKLKNEINFTYINNSKINNDSYINNINNITIIKNNTSRDYKTNKGKMDFFNEGKLFFESCFKGELIKNEKFSKSENPFISVVIPVYNQNKKINAVIRSIQNQNITNLEIILVNDYSKNNTLEIIQQMKNEDPRIILINNKKNMGTLYSRSIGTLLSNGKYIFALDHDDLFFDEGVLDLISQEAEKGKFDIVEFIAAEYNRNGFAPTYIKDSEYSDHMDNLTLFQPELGQFPRNKNQKYGIYDVFLWGKCIKSEIYKKTINLLGKEIYSQFIIWGEDLITSFVLFRTAKSFKFIRKYGIFRYKNRETASFHTPSSAFCLSHIIYLLIILRFTDNSFSDKQYVVFQSLNFLSYNLRYRPLNNITDSYLKKFLQEMNNCNYIHINDKNRINLKSKKWLKKNI